MAASGSTRGGITAEESAQEAARRIRASAEQRSRASGSPGPGGARPDRGGDPRTAAALSSLPASWSLLATGREPRLRHVAAVAVGPGGIFVVGSSGGAGAPGALGALRAPVALGSETSVRDPAASLSAAADLVSSLCGAPRAVVHPVLCRDGGEEQAETIAGVLVCDAASLVRTLTDRPTVLSPASVAGTCIRLDARLRGRSDLWLRAGTGDAAATGMGSRPVSRGRTTAQVLLALLLLVALLAAGAQVADRLGDTLPGPSQDAPSGR